MTGFRPFFSPATGEWVAARAAAVPDRRHLRRGWEFGRNEGWRITGRAGLITVLTLIAAVILTIPGSHGQRMRPVLRTRPV
jgi:hypothetical protein